MRKTKRYGWRADLPDGRDHIYVAPFLSAIRNPPVVDLRAKCPPVYDQGELGSCTANAIAGLDQFVQMKEGKQAFEPSRLFIYYNERVMEGTVDQDSGAQLRDGIKSVAKQGVCPEYMWTYDISTFDVKPTDACYKEALKHEAIEYSRVSASIMHLKSCLASGFPFVFGFTVFESFESDEVAQTGMVPMPSPDEQIMGGHAVCCVGYDDRMKCFIVRNSWGDSWGDHGYAYFPYAMLVGRGLASDFWTIRKVA